MIVGEILWPNYPVMAKTTLYRDHESRVQSQTDAHGMDNMTRWKIHNVIILRNLTTALIQPFEYLCENQKAGIAGVLFRIVLFPLASWNIITWENSFWPDAPNRVLKKVGTGNDAEVWIPKFIMPDTVRPELRTLPALEKVKILTTLGRLESVVAKTSDSLYYPARSTGISFIFSVDYVWHWEERSGLLLKFDASGSSHDGSTIFQSYEIERVVGKLVPTKEQRSKKTPADIASERILTVQLDQTKDYSPATDRLSEIALLALIGALIISIYSLRK